MMSQNLMVLHHMETEGSITPKEAMDEYGIMRLGARIYDLKQAGYKVNRIMVTAASGMRCVLRGITWGGRK